MSEIVIDFLVENKGTAVYSYVNKVQADLLMKGYKLKKEWKVKDVKLDVGTGFEVEKKMEKKSKYNIKMAFRRVGDDIRVTGWPSSSKQELSPSIIDEINKSLENIKNKI